MKFRCVAPEFVAITGSYDELPLKVDGRGRYYLSDSDWGEVFPARIVPLSTELPQNLGESVYGHKPIFEPEYFGHFRHIFMISYGGEIMKAYSKIRANFPRSYFQEVYQGELAITFSATDPDDLNHDLHPQIKYLYSNFLES
ncbi:MAG: hypothetical protein QNJ72_08370 [Pleurocapsa sp. MO_226.B13]|nr:hypothetical protein [Pleurocapsa sp. MO_226.B13]